METRKFFDETVLLRSATAQKLYASVKTLPIVDYHSHLSEKEIAEDKKFTTITEFWLKGDHYKWRAMRMCGVAEKYITGDAGDYEKFLAYATVLPKLLGNPLYYWTHMELKTIFGIDMPLNADTARAVYERANETLKTLSVRSLLKMFGVEYVATTDDPTSPLTHHGVYDGVRVCPTFRTDRILKADEGSIAALAKAWGRSIETLADFCEALESRLQFFVSKGCTIADVSVERVPDGDVSEEEANALFAKRGALTQEETHRFYSFCMGYLGGLYKRYGITWQLHIGALRNINKVAFAKLGADTGYDVIGGFVDTDAVAAFLGALHAKGNLPKILLYTLNANALPALCTISGAFENVRMGAAWWFNDTLAGIRSHLNVLQEYSAFGAFPGMVTDSRSFSSYCRFDFFRRILADAVAEKVEAGEYDAASAEVLLKDICYANPKTFLSI